MTTILVTGGAGFIGSALIRELIAATAHDIVNVDSLTYAGNPDSLADVSDDARYAFERVDITDRAALNRVFARHQPAAVMHLAAESHVDRSIDDPGIFISTNVAGTCTLLEAARAYWSGLDDARRHAFRFLHVSTDEVHGDLGPAAPPFSEASAYAPSSPYAASKAAADHLVRAWHRTYGLPVLLTCCSNNYGPRQFPEKLIPHMILSALQGRPLPVYGDGAQVRDWLHVDDHARALRMVLERGRTGETYHVGGHGEQRNLDVVRAICALLDELAPARRPAGAAGYAGLITRVPDRPGHDARYAIDAGKIGSELGWRPRASFDSGLRDTVRWYLDNEAWWRRLLAGDRRQACTDMAGRREGA